jgi:hypothetical protein
MTLFPEVYVHFPGTSRSHLPLQTGGVTITWGSTYEDMKSPYPGASLPGALKRAGLSTGLFSAQYVGDENLGTFYRHLPWDHIEAYDSAEEAPEKLHLNSWGMDERYVLAHALAWADAQTGPFFLELMTSSTHHPYGAPADFLPAAAGGGDGPADRRARYTRSIRFSDKVIEALF